MHINNIFLLNYRNYEQQSIELDKGINIFYGQNAQGKTNIIESVYMASTGKSHRTQKDSEIIKWGCTESKVKISYDRDGSNNDIEIYLSKSAKKSVKLNGVKLTKLGDLIGNLNTVIFSPDHMKIIKEGPIERRRFMDIILCQIKPGYYHNLSQYLKVLEQRNNLLNEAFENQSVLSTIDIWDEQLVNYGTKVMNERMLFLDKLDVYAKETHSEITNGKEKLKLRYKSFSKNDHINEKELKECYYRELKNSLSMDVRRGITHIGPHRDDIYIFIDGKEVKNYGSQGQQRTSLLSLKISELKYMDYEMSVLPVLLLDDVFSELDVERQKYLVNFIKNVQTVITCTDVGYFRQLGSETYSLYNVVGGNVVKK